MLSAARLNQEFDLLIIGGGATGSGAALDAAKRGLKVICIEQEDFASATSSRSTKLLWGGSRYLVQALVSLLSFDLRLLRAPASTMKKFMEEFRMVLNCHRERTFMMKNQPHLTQWLPIAVPLDKWLIWPPPFGYPPAALGPLGLFVLFFKFYDALSGFQCPPSHVMSRQRALRKFPQLDCGKIKYCSVFYEGMHDDARTNLAVAQTAALEGAVVLNYLQATSFLREGEGEATGRVVGARVEDKVTGDSFAIRAKSVLLCGGPFTDELRRLEEPHCSPAVTGAAGTHIVLPAYFAPAGIGLVDMSTSDGRFLFFLPWNDHVLVGTTDHPCRPSMRPVAQEAEIMWLLHEASKYLSPELRLRRGDVLSAWAGIRPLASDPHASSSAQASRDHVVSHNPHTGVVFVSGGKWTTFREMAQDAVDKVIAVTPQLRSLQSQLFPCSTLHTHLVGFEGYSENLAARLAQQHDVSFAVAQRLARAYGGRAQQVLRIAQEEATMWEGEGSAEKEERLLLVPGHPILQAEVTFAARCDWALHCEDVLARRTRLLFLDKAAALRALPRVVRLMAKELRWDEATQQAETQRCLQYMRHFGGARPRSEAELEEEHRARLATLADLKDAFRRVQPSLAAVSRAQLQLIAELLQHPLSEAELQDCVRTAAEQHKDEYGWVSLEALQAWWNSERLNPGLVDLRQRKIATAQQVEGSGTLFG
jgi:glycerol-3-phosphate dehydrogenase